MKTAFSSFPCSYSVSMCKILKGDGRDIMSIAAIIANHALYIRAQKNWAANYCSLLFNHRDERMNVTVGQRTFSS